jgi:hypothetical protein
VSDLRDVGQIEQDAGAITLLHRKDAYEPAGARAGGLDLVVTGKNRNGAARTGTAAHQRHVARIRDMARQDDQIPAATPERSPGSRSPTRRQNPTEGGDRPSQPRTQIHPTRGTGRPCPGGTNSSARTAPAASGATKPSPAGWTPWPAASPPPSPPGAACAPACTVSSAPTTLAKGREAGLAVAGRTPRAWLQGTRSPSGKNPERTEQAYRTVRRENVARHLLARLDREGRGTRVQTHPLNRSRVDRLRRRVIEYRTLTIRHWDRIVRARAAGGGQELDDARTDQVAAPGSQWGQYEYVTSTGFTA